MRKTIAATAANVLNKVGRVDVICLIRGIKVLNRTKTMPAVTIAILRRGGGGGIVIG
jgi:hypothetical protein